MQTKIFRIYGPPGTGKTTALLNKVDEALRQGIPPSKIGYFAFTRQAAYEAVDLRACQRFGLDENQLPWFRTLHSFALRLSGIRAEQVMQNEHYKELSDTIGIKLVPDNGGGDNMFESSANADPYLSIINLARLKKIPLRKQYNQSDSNIDWMTLSYVARSIQSYKKTD